MGITCSLSSANPTHVRLLKANPMLVEPFLAEDEDKAAFSSTWIERLLRRKASVPAEILSVDDSMRTDIDKAWHGIHFLLTGSSEEAPLPAGFLLSGGQPLAGASHLLNPSEVAECHRYLSTLADDQLAESYAPDRMEEFDIYPGMWRRDGA